MSERNQATTSDWVVRELISMAEMIELRADEIRAMGGSLNAYGAVEMLRKRAEHIRSLESGDL